MLILMQLLFFFFFSYGLLVLLIPMIKKVHHFINRFMHAFSLSSPHLNSHLINKTFSGKNSDAVNNSNLNVLVFSGGTGFREINMSLAHKTKNITRILPIWDNGGSSKSLRESFQLMPVGDLRHALMTQAHGEERVSSVVKLFNWRLSSSGDRKVLQNELNSFINNQHPLITNIEKSLANVVLGYLKQFAESLPSDMDLKNGSIGNFVLVGAYLAHKKDINTAIYVFRQICSIRGSVWPVSLHNDLHINAILDNQDIILGQANTTQSNRQLHQEKIHHIVFNSNQQANTASQHEIAEANPLVLNAIKQAQIIVYGPGSFFTSILPHLMVEQIAATIAQQNTPKVFITNLIEDKETIGYQIDELIHLFLKTAEKFALKNSPLNQPNSYQASQFITHILINKSHSTPEHTMNNLHYLGLGKSITKLQDLGIELIIDDLESPWKRGHHDAEWIADYILSTGKI